MQMLQINIKKALLFLIIAVLFFIDITFASVKQADHGDTFVTAGISDARTLIPILASDSVSSTIVSMIYSGLLKYDKDLNLIGDLAHKWEVLDKGKRIIFYLRDDVKWHDGKSFSAKDVKFTYQRIIDPDIPTPYKSNFNNVKEFKIIDDYTIEIIYDEAFAPALSNWTMPIMSKSFLENKNLMQPEFSRKAIGSGPFKFKRWISDERIDLLANKDYYLDGPYIDRYIYKIISDPATIFLELQVEDIDLAPLSPLQYTKLATTKHFKNKFDKYEYPGSIYVYMGYNLNRDIFKDKRVRQALNYAVDKQEIIDGILLGKGKVSTGPFSPKSWAYNNEVKPIIYDKQKALNLFKKAGWADSDSDGFLDKDGKIFEFTIITNHGNDKRINTAQIIQQRLKDIGIKVHIRVYEWGLFISEFITKHDFDALILGWNTPEEPDCYDIWHSSKTKQGEFNFISYKNPVIDDLLLKGRREFDQNKRKQIYNKIQKILYEDQPYMFLYVPDALVAVNKRFEDVTVAAAGIMHNFTEWYVQSQNQRYTMLR